MRHSRFGLANELSQIADAALAVGQRIDQSDASRIPKQAEDIGDRIDGRRRQQAGPNLQEERFMSASVGSLTSKIARRINPSCSVSSLGKDVGQERSRHDI